MPEVRVCDADEERWWPPAAELLRLVVPVACAGLTPYDSGRFARFLAAGCAVPPGSRTLVLRAALADGRLAGVADWRLLGPVLFLNGVAVAGDQRRAGIGRHLLADGVEVARAAGVSAIELDVADDNAAAAALYQRMGFQAVGGSTWWALDGGAASGPGEGRLAGAAAGTPPVPTDAATSPGWRLRTWPAFSAHHAAYGFGDLQVSQGDGVLDVRVLAGGWRVSGGASDLSATDDAGTLATLMAALAPIVPGGRPARVFTAGETRPGGPPGPVLAAFRRLRLDL
ncbi:GNAT family N-acetyltransferase [Actinopolymorpha alba]|uniref:GNAT family N-acetyltransferase n=1 Tax=Actinopolymorpha alba TaxID=533267 RepID=UPI00036BA2E2|nr:GNAT family N-acetyltransferase [Actinopolymorpha alba]